MFHCRISTTVCLITLAFISLPLLASAGNQGGVIIDHGPRSSPKIALTFDACPTKLRDEYDEKAIDILIREKVPATLFLSGKWVEKNTERVKFLASHPQFEIAAHSYYHPHMTKLTDERVMRELKQTQAIIKTVTGKTPRYFRAPYGEVDDRVVMLASATGLTTIQYDVASGDPDSHLTPQKIVRYVLQDAKNGSIIVFHMNHKGVHTAEILPEIIKGLREKGFILVTVEDLLAQ
jgi:peptidoglycan-N-acetylglucosamine deacetylase